MLRMFSCLLGYVVIASAIVAQEASVLSVESGDSTHAFMVETVSTPEDIERGLMERETLATDAGMLFDFGEVQPRSMWMKNTLIALDILFLDAQGQVIAIARNAVPQSERLIQSGAPVRAVLEINGGQAKTLGIQPGDQVRHTVFENVTEEAD